MLSSSLKVLAFHRDFHIRKRSARIPSVRADFGALFVSACRRVGSLETAKMTPTAGDSNSSDNVLEVFAIDSSVMKNLMVEGQSKYFHFPKVTNLQLLLLASELTSPTSIILGEFESFAKMFPNLTSVTVRKQTEEIISSTSTSGSASDSFCECVEDSEDDRLVIDEDPVAQDSACSLATTSMETHPVMLTASMSTRGRVKRTARKCDLTAEVVLHKEMVETLGMLFPFVTNLTGKYDLHDAELYRGLITDYGAICRVWPKLRKIELYGAELSYFPPVNVDRDFCGLGLAEILEIRDKDDDFLKTVHLVPQYPSVVALKHLRKLRISFRDIPPCDRLLRRKNLFLSEAAAILTFLRRSNFDAKFYYNESEFGNDLEHLKPFVRVSRNRYKSVVDMENPTLVKIRSI